MFTISSGSEFVLQYHFPYCPPAVPFRCVERVDEKQLCVLLLQVGTVGKNWASLGIIRRAINECDSLDGKVFSSTYTGEQRWKKAYFNIHALGLFDPSL
jgi:hypothetical protein